MGDGRGIALTALGGRGASMSKGKIANMFVFKLDPTATLRSVKFYPKTVTNAILPVGSGFMGAGLPGQIIKSQGDFDYQFLQRNEARTQLNVVFLNFDKEKGEAAKGYVGNIAFGDNGKYALDKIDLTSRATYSFVFPAKPGYVLITDYFKKKSELGMKLVKLNISGRSTRILSKWPGIRRAIFCAGYFG